MEDKHLIKVLEALLFAAEKPLSLQRLDQIISETQRKQIEMALDKLKKLYNDHAFCIIKIGGGYQIVSRPEYYEWIGRMYSTRSRPRLSQAALETLSVIAFKQLVSRIEIEAIRGVNSDGVLGTLLERNLITIRGRAETVGRSLLYGTTEDFLHYFGLNNLSELPRPDEIEALLQKREEEYQKVEDEQASDTIHQDET